MALTKEQGAKGGRKSKGGGRPSNKAREFWRKHQAGARKRFLELLRCGDPRVERDVAKYIIEKNEGKIGERFELTGADGAPLMPDWVTLRLAEERAKMRKSPERGKNG